MHKSTEICGWHIKYWYKTQVWIEIPWTQSILQSAWVRSMQFWTQPLQERFAWLVSQTKHFQVQFPIDYAYETSKQVGL